MMSQKKIAFYTSEKWPFDDLGGGITRQIMVYDDEIMMVKVLFEQGAIGYAHNHPHRQVSYVTSGAFEVTIDGVKKVLKRGDAFYVEPDIRHGVLCIEEGAIIDVFNPAREDFLK